MFKITVRISLDNLLHIIFSTTYQQILCIVYFVLYLKSKRSNSKSEKFQITIIFYLIDI